MDNIECSFAKTCLCNFVIWQARKSPQPPPLFLFSSHPILHQYFSLSSEECLMVSFLECLVTQKTLIERPNEHSSALKGPIWLFWSVCLPPESCLTAFCLVRDNKAMSRTHHLCTDCLMKIYFSLLYVLLSAKGHK